MRTAVRTLAITFTALALAAGSAQAQGRHGGFGGHGGGGGGAHFVGHGGYGHGGPGYWRGGGYRGWGPGLVWGGIGLGLGLGLGSYYGSPYYPTYVYPDVVVSPPPVVYYQQQAVPASPAPASRSAPDPVVYPRNGQSAAQTEADQQDCNRWATTQRNAMADASVFQRATAACMDGRGYTIR